MFCKPISIVTNPSAVFILLLLIKYALGMVSTFFFFAIMILASPESPGYNTFGAFSNTACTLKV